MDYFTPINIILFAIVVFIYFYLKQKYSFWKRTDIPYIEPTFPHGNLNGFMSKTRIADKVAEFYRKLKGKGPFGGLYLTISPAVVALDLDFIRTILTRDFDYFQSHGFYYNERDDPLSANVITIEGAKWKSLRDRLSPSFSANKMKYMFPTFLEVAQRLKVTVNRMCAWPGGGTVDIKDILHRYTSDVIGSVAFGVECDSLTDPNDQFKVLGRRVVDDLRHPWFVVLLMSVFPKLATFFRMKVFKDDLTEVFLELVAENVAFREENNIERPDFLDIMLKAKHWESESRSFQQFSIEEIAAQIFTFFVAGFETSSTTISMALYELAQQPDLQERARDEIAKAFKASPEGLTYEAISELTYIDMIIFETLRKYPTIGVIFRKCTHDYPVPNTNFTLTKGMMVWIPVQGIQQDPEFYPEPEIFNPDRFTYDNIKKRDPMTFLPFGDGPRACLGLRFAMMEARIALYILLMNFEFSVCGRTVIPMRFSKKDLFSTPETGVWLNVKKIK